MTIVEQGTEPQVNPYDSEVLGLFRADPFDRKAAMLGRVARVAPEFQPAAEQVAAMALHLVEIPHRMYEARGHLAVLDQMIAATEAR